MIDPHPSHPSAVHDQIRWTTQFLHAALSLVDDAYIHVVPAAEWGDPDMPCIVTATGYRPPTIDDNGHPTFRYSPEVIALSMASVGLPWSPERDARYLVATPDRSIAYADNYVRLICDMLIGAVIAGRNHPDETPEQWLTRAEDDAAARFTDALVLLSHVHADALDRHFKDHT